MGQFMDLLSRTLFQLLAAACYKTTEKPAIIRRILMSTCLSLLSEITFSSLQWIENS